MKLISLLLALLLCCCGVACADAPVDPVLVELPEDQMFGEYWLGWNSGNWLVDDDLVLTQAGSVDRYQRGLLNLTTGEFTPLRLHEDFEVGNEGNPRLRLWQDMPEEQLIRRLEPRLHRLLFRSNDQHFLFWYPYWICAANQETGVIQSTGIPLSMDESQVGLTPWNQIYRMWRNGILVYTLEGEGVCSYTPSDEEVILGAFPMNDGFLLLTATRDEPDEDDFFILPLGVIHVVITDEQLNILSESRLSTMPVDGWETDIFQIGDDDGFLVSVDRGNGILLFDKSWNARVLVERDEELMVVPYEDTEEIENYLRQTCAAPVGVADDGSYALFTSWDDGLFKLDLQTLEITQQMSREEFAALRFEENEYLYWPGGEYLTDGGGTLYRLVDRSTLPAE